MKEVSQAIEKVKQEVQLSELNTSHQPEHCGRAS